jgi:hypothetical protein
MVMYGLVFSCMTLNCLVLARDDPHLVVLISLEVIVMLKVKAKGCLAELVRWPRRHSLGPEFDSPWERISGWG